MSDLVLTGRNLGERQKELNLKVIEAASKGVKLDSNSNEPKTDVAKLFQIDLASKYKDAAYITQVLKSGDGMHISRALKCTWFYDDEFTSIVNPDYLHHEIFPLMSMRMKRKMLTAIASEVKNDKRNQDFYSYCLSGKLMENSWKFLLRTSDDYKMKIINENSIYFNSSERSCYSQFFIGSSFELAEVVLTRFKETDGVYKLHFLYSKSDVKYLDLLEKYGDDKESMFKDKLGIRVSRDIIKKHKDRMLKKPWLYGSKLNVNILLKNCSVDEVKLFATAFLPEKANRFWWIHYCSTYKEFIDRIPSEERFQFVKHIFNEQYPGEEFEMNKEFYWGGDYRIMTKEEQSNWGLICLERQEQNHGPEKYEKWIPFIKFEKAFELVKKRIHVTTNLHARKLLLQAIVKCVENECELEKLLSYFYERHVNEKSYLREGFLSEVISSHDVFNFKESTWNIFYKLFRSLHNFEQHILLIYLIIHNKELPSDVKTYALEIDHDIYRIASILKKHDQRMEVVFNYLLALKVDAIKDLQKNCNNDADDVKNTIKNQVKSIQYLFQHFKKSEDIMPEFVKNLISEFKIGTNNDHLTEDKIMRLLKKDARLITDFSRIITNVRIDRVLRKLKIYFANDIAQEYVKFFSELIKNNTITDHEIIYTAIYGILQLADENFKKELLLKYAPTQAKIDYSAIDLRMLNIQEAVCKFVCFSRPRLPLENVLMYMKGDYLHFCLPMFGHYLANLPQLECSSFVETLIDSPVSIKKHGLRLAFHCFSIEKQKNIMFDAWKKTKNVTLRMIIYKLLHRNILQLEGEKQKECVEILRTLTLDLNEDDDEDIFRIITRPYLPDHLKGVYLEAFWKTLRKFRENQRNLDLKSSCLREIQSNVHLNKDLVWNLTEQHIKETFIENKIKPRNQLNSLEQMRRDLVSDYIAHFDDSESIKTNLEMVKLLTKKCTEKWDEVVSDIYVVREYYNEFLQNLILTNFSTRMSREDKRHSSLNLILEYLLAELLPTSPHEKYLTEWDLKLAIITNGMLDIAIEKVKEGKDENNISKEIGYKFGENIGNLVLEYVSKGLYCKTFAYKISRKIDSYIEKLYNLPQMSCRMAIVLGMMNFKMAEIYLIAVNMVPLECPENYEKEYKDVLNKIRKLEDRDVQCEYYQKFVYDDYKRRKFVL